VAYSITGFNHQRIDPVSGCYHPGNGYRAYHPRLMRFNAPDGWSPFDAGGINSYSYCAGDPINRSDPSGHFSWQAALGMSMGILGIIGTLFTGGASLIAAGGIDAAMISASATALLAGTSGTTADISGILSFTTAANNPRASAALGWLSFASGLLSLGAGLLSSGARMPGRSMADTARVSDIRHFEFCYAESAERLSAADNAAASYRQSWQQARSWIADDKNFRHYIINNRIHSQDLHNKSNFFGNKFKSKQWTFINNARLVKEVPYYASDVARYQFEIIAGEKNFIGMLPEIIIRKSVSNEFTLATTKGKEGRELFAAFFTTPNGKSTQHIMNAFGLTAFQVERLESEQSVDFIIKLNPQS